MDWIKPAQPTPIWSDSSVYHQLMKDDAWIAEPKADGWRCMLYFDGGKAKARTRQERVMAINVEPEVFHKVPDGTVLDGEWMRGANQLIIWDVLAIDGLPTKLTLRERRPWLKEHLPQIGPVRIIQRLKKDSETLSRALKAGYEGIVLKNLDKPYPGSGKCFSWFKVKG